MMSSYKLKWIIISAIPIITALILNLREAPTNLSYLIGGIILACEAAFLFKFVLFEIIKHHLRKEIPARNRSTWLLLPIIATIIYIIYYFSLY